MWLDERRAVYADRHQRIYRRDATVGGVSKTYQVTDYGGRAALVLVHSGRILLVRQYRMLIDRVAWEIPGGRIDAGESAEAAAVRECLEETGVRAGGVRHLLDFMPGMDTLNNPTSIFSASEVISDTGARHEDEVLPPVWVPFDRALEMALDGTIVDSLSIVGILAYRQLRMPA